MDRITNALNELNLAIKADTQGEITETEVQMLYALADICSAKVRYNNLAREYNECLDSNEIAVLSSYLGNKVVESDERNG